MSQYIRMQMRLGERGGKDSGDKLGKKREAEFNIKQQKSRT